MIQLSKHVDFDMMTHTDHVDLIQRNKLEANSFIQNMICLADPLLDAIWEKYNGYTISSGFRGQSLNLRVKGVPTSYHCKGLAADLCRDDWTWAALDAVCNWIAKQSDLKFDQIIREEHWSEEHKRMVHWLHVGAGGAWRGQALDYKDGKYTTRA